MPCRLLLSHHIALNGDDGAEAIPVQFAQDQNGIVLRPIPASDVGQRFPAGSFRIDPSQDTSIERIGGDELLFADGRSRHQPYLTIMTSKATTASFRITGGLIPTTEISETVAAAEQPRIERFWRDMMGAGS